MYHTSKISWRHQIRNLNLFFQHILTSHLTWNTKRKISPFLLEKCIQNHSGTKPRNDFIIVIPSHKESVAMTILDQIHIILFKQLSIIQVTFFMFTDMIRVLLKTSEQAFSVISNDTVHCFDRNKNCQKLRYKQL